MQRGLFEIANAILIHHDPVAALQHLAGDQRVRGVGVVEQRRLSGGGDVNSERQNEQGEDGESAIHLVSRAFCLSLCRTGVVGRSAYDEGVIIAFEWAWREIKTPAQAELGPGKPFESVTVRPGWRGLRGTRL